MKKYNVLFLFSDQHNAKCMSFRGHPQVKTPYLDQLAEDGICFTNAYTNNPTCTPSRMSFLSGLYPSTHGYYGLYGNEPCFPMTNMFSYFREHGYRTGALGKLHTPRYWIERDCQFIYDEFIEYPKYLEGLGLYEKNDNRKFCGERSGNTSYIPFEHSCESMLAKQFFRFLNNEGEPADRGDSSQPWFAWVSFSRPHKPYTPSEPYADMYPPEELILPPISKDEKDSVLQKRGAIQEGDLKGKVSAYLGLVSQVDTCIGDIMHRLSQTGQLDNTIIVYSADHGDYAGEHGLYEKKGGISYRAITNIPFIIKVPGVQGGRTTSAIIEAVDLFPTLCELLDIPIVNTVQGISQKAVIDGTVDAIRESALTENPYRKAIATSQWRYIANIDGEDDELYHISEDPWELQNLINDPACQDVVLKMQRLLLERVVTARKPITTLNGFWHKHVYDRDGRIDLERCGARTPYW